MTDVLARPRTPTSVPLPLSPDVSSFAAAQRPPSPPASLPSDAPPLPQVSLCNAVQSASLPPTFKMVPPTPLTPGDDERFASPVLASTSESADEPDAAVNTPTSTSEPADERTAELASCSSGVADVSAPVAAASTESSKAPSASAEPPIQRAVPRKISILGFNKSSLSSKDAVSCSTTTAPSPPAPVSAPVIAPPAVFKQAVEVPVSTTASAAALASMGSKRTSTGGGGLAGMFRSLTLRKKPSVDGGKGGLLAKGRSVLEARHEQARLEKEAAEAEAIRTAERRHREASHLLGQPMRRLPSNGVAGASADGATREVHHFVLTASSDLIRAHSREVPVAASAAGATAAPAPTVHVPLAKAVNERSARDSSPGGSSSSPVPIGAVRPPLATASSRPPALRISISSRSHASARFSSSLSSAGGTPLSPFEGEEASYVRARQKRLHDSVTTPPALSHSPGSYDGAFSEDFPFTVDQHQHRRSQSVQPRSPQTPVAESSASEFGTSAPDEFAGKRGRLGKAFGSLNTHGYHMHSKTISHTKRSSSTGPGNGVSARTTRTSASPQVLSRAEVAARVSQASEQDQRDVDTFFSL